MSKQIIESSYNEVVNLSDFFTVYWNLKTISLDPEKCIKFLQLVKQQKEHQKICLFITEWEPILSNLISNIFKQCKKLDIITAIQTNGDFDSSWIINSSKFIDSIILIYHPENNYFEKFSENVKLCEQLIPDVTVSFLVSHSNFENIFNKAMKLVETYFFTIKVRLEPMTDFKGKIIDEYSKEEKYKLSQVTNFWPSSTLPERAEKWNNDEFKGYLFPEYYISIEKNSWLNWKCSAGIESIFVEFDNIKLSMNCSEKIIGSIYDENFKLQQNLVVCEREYCQNRFNMFLSKFKEE